MNVKKVILAAMAVLLCIIFIDETGVAVTLPQVQLDLNISNLGIQWVMNAMFLPLAILILFAGKLSDHIGHKKTFSWGMWIFLLASVICTFAPNGAILIAGRALQGVGVSFLLATYAVLISMVFQPHERGQALGTCASIASLFLATGPLIAGLLTHYASWRLIFAANIPLGLVSLYLIHRAIPKDIVASNKKDFDYQGLILFILGFSAIIFALMQAVVLGWTSMVTIGLLILGLILLSIFTKLELNKKRNPLADLRLFKNKTFLAGNVILLSTQVVVMTLTYWAIWLQEGLGYSPLVAGLGLLPAGIPILFMARFGGIWLDRYGPRQPICLGSAIVFMGMLWLTLTAPLQSYGFAFWGFLAYGIGAPLIISPAIATVLENAPATAKGMAAGILNTMRQLGATLCFAIVGVVILNYSKLTGHSYTMAFTHGMGVTSFFAFISLFFAWFFLKKSVTKTGE